MLKLTKKCLKKLCKFSTCLYLLVVIIILNKMNILINNYLYSINDRNIGDNSDRKNY